jgi:iron(III) transport system substrate-binding protein
MNTTRRSLLLGAGIGLASAATAQAQSELQDTIAAARREGRVDYIEAVIMDETVQELADGFRSQYGLPSSFQVNYTLINTGAMVTRLEQELSAKRLTADVVGLATPSWVFARAASGDILPYASPEYPKYRRVFELGMGKDGYFAFNGAYFFVPVWNADTLDFKGTSWNDVIGAVPEGRINMGNAQTSLANLVTFMGVRKVMGDDFYPKIAAMRPRIIQAGEMAHDRLVTGQDLFSLYGQATHVKHRNDLGARLKMMIPKEGLVLLPQCLFILKQAAHPNASKLWLDFMLSEAGQKIQIARESLISGRDGAPSALPDYPLSLDRLKVIPVDWERMTSDDLAKARADWGAIFK